MKKLLILALSVLIIASCKKESATDLSAQPEMSAADYARIVDVAMSKNEKGENNFDNKFGGKDDKDDDKGKDRDEKGKDDKDKDDKGKKLETKIIKSTGSGNISYIPNGCGDGTLRFLSNGTGNSTVLGVFQQETSFCIDMATQQMLTLPTGVGTTPNGDKLFYALAGVGVDAATGFMYQDYVFTGGTGKYARLTGNMRLLYSVNTPTNYKYTGTGTITF